MATAHVQEQASHRPRLDVLAAIAAGGAIGAVARWIISEAFPVRWQQFPWSTFAENVSGAFLLGLAVAVIVSMHSKSRLLLPFLGIGVLGSFTTFSNFSDEILTLAKNDRAALAIAYMSGSVLCGLLAASFGILLGRAIMQRHARGRAAP